MAINGIVEAALITQTSWFAAQQFCIGKGGRLAILDRESVLNSINTKFGQEEIWIGASDVDKNHKWRWIN